MYSRNFGILLAAMAAMFPPTFRIVDPIPDRKPPKKYARRLASVFPHSSTRQRARYARQIAAGQLRMAGIYATGNDRIISELMADDPDLTIAEAKELIREAEAATEAPPPCGEGLGRGNS